MSQFQSNEHKHLSESARKQKELLDSIPPDQVPPPPPPMPEESPASRPSGPSGDGDVSFQVRQLAGLPEQMDQKEILIEIRETLREMLEFLRERMSDGI